MKKWFGFQRYKNIFDAVSVKNIFDYETTVSTERTIVVKVLRFGDGGKA
jgi:hypothetical protein